MLRPLQVQVQVQGLGPGQVLGLGQVPELVPKLGEIGRAHV